MQQIDWSMAPNDATHAGWCEGALCWYTSVGDTRYKVSGNSMIQWNEMNGKPLCDELIVRPMSGQIDWNEAPDDTTHCGYVAFGDGKQYGNILIWYKSITLSGYRYWKKGESITWQSVAGQPLSKTLIPRPTVSNATRDEALAWCVENLDYWPSDGTPVIDLPRGWAWYGDTTRMVLRCTYSTSESDVQTSHWHSKKFARPSNDADKSQLIATMKLRSTSRWSSGDCTVLPKGWMWVAADGIHPYRDTLKRLKDGAIVTFDDVHGFGGDGIPPVNYPGANDVSSRPKDDGVPIIEAVAWVPDQPNADPLIKRPTVSSATRDEALAWCVENLDIWYAEPKGKPEGWSWIKVDEWVRLYPDNHKGLYITRSEWSVVKHATPKPPVNLNCHCITTPVTISKGYNPPTQCTVKGWNAAIHTLERLGYTYNGGQLWKPPIGKAPDFIEFDGWNVGDKCWISNEKGYDIAENRFDLLGFHIESTVTSLFTATSGLKIAVVHHGDKGHICWILDMLKRPLTDSERVERRFKDIMNSGASHDAKIATILDEYDVTLKVES